MDFFQLFNNREIAVGIWCAALLIYLSTKSNPKKLIVSFFSGKVLPFYLIIILYLTTIIIILNVFGFWENVYYKEFIIWFFTVGLVLFFSANKLQESNDFKKIVIRLFSISILWEFIVSQYTFPLTIELVIVPFFGILIALWVKVSHNKEKIEFLKVSKILGNILFLSGFIFSLFVFYNLTQSYKDLLTVSNIKSLLLFPFFTLLFLPVVFLTTVYMKYEIIFIKLKTYNFIDNDRRNEIRKAILLCCHLNLYYLDKAKEIILSDKKEIRDNENIFRYFKTKMVNP